MRLSALIFAALAASTLSWSGPGHSAPAPKTVAAEERLAHISVTTMGKGAPVVLIPGLSTPRAVWDGIAPELARDHEVILVQVDGFAGDDPGENLESGILDGIARDLHAYIASHRLDRLKLIGHSMGGLAALEFAHLYPDQVDRVGIVDALPFFAVLMDPGATVDAVKPTAELMRQKVASAYGKPADPAAIEANVRSLALKPASIARMKQWAAAADSRVTAEALFEDLTTDIRPQLSAITTPVTIFFPWTNSGFGEERTLAFYKRQYATLPQVTFVGIADAGHFVMFDQPQAFAAAVDAFLR